eukprot:GHVQ01028717.1.p1 GENE.GHVQ01028717.1~~GHVQ01028717.1.p1  ORF type:complete len:538 (+),score=92.12 GHVQ01028717.1:261-1874(+)
MSNLVRDILGSSQPSQPLHSPSPTPAPSSVAGSTSTKKRPPNGMSREVYRLCGEGMVSLPSSQLASTQHGTKTTAQKWRMVYFSNSAAANKRMKLRHWSKSSTVSSVPVGAREMSKAIPCSLKDNRDYLFASFSAGISNPSPGVMLSSRVIHYDTQIYNAYLANLDSSWTKEETDFFWDLCNLYDLQFFVIADRYPPHFNRSIEALKYRYYSIAKVLTELKYERKINAEKSKLHASPSSQFYAQAANNVNRLIDEKSRDPFLKFVYSPPQDAERKVMLDRQFRSSEADKQAEKKVVETIKKQYLKSGKKPEPRNPAEAALYGKPLPSHPGSASSGQSAPSVHLSSQVIERLKSTIEKRHADIIDQEIDKKVPLSSAAHLRLVSHPYPSISSDSEHVAVSTSVWLQPHHYFILHTSTYFPPSPTPAHFLPSILQRTPPNASGSAQIPVPSSSSSPMSPLPSAIPNLISAFTRVYSENVSTLIASIKTDMALHLNLREKLEALQRELSYLKRNTLLELQQKTTSAVAKTVPNAPGLSPV